MSDNESRIIQYGLGYHNPNAGNYSGSLDFWVGQNNAKRDAAVGAASGEAIAGLLVIAVAIPIIGVLVISALTFAIGWLLYYVTSESYKLYQECKKSEKTRKETLLVLKILGAALYIAVLLIPAIDLCSNILFFLEDKYRSIVERQPEVPPFSNPQRVETVKNVEINQSVEPAVSNDVAQSDLTLPTSPEALVDFGGQRPQKSNIETPPLSEDLSDFGGQRPVIKRTFKRIFTRIFSNRSFILSSTCEAKGPNFWIELPSMGLNHEMNVEGYDAKGRRLFSQWLGSVSDNFVGYADSSNKLGQTAELRYIAKYVPDDFGPDSPARIVKTVHVRLNRHQRSSFIACYRQAGLLPQYRSSAF